MRNVEEALRHIKDAIKKHPKPAAGVHAERAHQYLLDAPDKDDFEHSDEWSSALVQAANACHTFMDEADEFYAGLALGKAKTNLERLVMDDE